MSWKPEVMVWGEKKWAGNGLRFATKEEAEANARDLMRRWLAVTDTRATESDDPVNYKWDGKLIPVSAAAHVAEFAETGMTALDADDPEKTHEVLTAILGKD